jgi:hypothetical protein
MPRARRPSRNDKKVVGQIRSPPMKFCHHIYGRLCQREIQIPHSALSEHLQPWRSSDMVGSSSPARSARLVAATSAMAAMSVVVAYSYAPILPVAVSISNLAGTDLSRRGRSDSINCRWSLDPLLPLRCWFYWNSVEHWEHCVAYFCGGVSFFPDLCAIYCPSNSK